MIVAYFVTHYLVSLYMPTFVVCHYYHNTINSCIRDSTKKTKEQ